MPSSLEPGTTTLDLITPTDMRALELKIDRIREATLAAMRLMTAS
jgi:hypothetical protein